MNMPPFDPRRDQVEPSADTREGAHAVREMYIALTMEGFGEQQALYIVGVTLAAAAQSGTPNG